MKRYKTVTVHRRVKLINLHQIKGDYFDITYRKRVRVKRKKQISSSELTFLENGYVVIWGEESAHFTPQTFRLLEQLWRAEGHLLSKEDVRQDVIEDEDASEEVVRSSIRRVRQELAKVNFPYEIQTIRAKGYKFRLSRT